MSRSWLGTPGKLKNFLRYSSTFCLLILFFITFFERSDLGGQSERDIELVEIRARIVCLLGVVHPASSHRKLKKLSWKNEHF